jgi:hypothetical protein
MYTAQGEYQCKQNAQKKVVEGFGLKPIPTAKCIGEWVKDKQRLSDQCYGELNGFGFDIPEQLPPLTSTPPAKKK